jgi:hypothetical protein
MSKPYQQIISEVKRLSIVDFLHDQGKFPVKETPKFALYHAPYRSDKNPSFVVYKSDNYWVDLSTAYGGDIIDLVMKLFNIGIEKAICYLNENSLNFSIIESCNLKQNSGGSVFYDIATKGLISSNLCLYLKDRAIDLDIATKYCVEVHYCYNGRKYYAVGFENIMHDYEVRNKFFKGCIGNKAISFIKTANDNTICLVFEGFMDMLSYVTLSRFDEKYVFTSGMDILVLNSVALAKKIIPYIANYSTVECYLDNDEAGKSTAELLNSLSNGKIVDKSHLYSGFKDLNEYLQNYIPNNNK